MRTIAVVGTSVAGARAARSLRDAGFDGRLVLVGDDAHRPYDRPPLSKDFLAGTVDAPDIALLDEQDEADLAVELHLGVRVERLDPAAARLRCSDGREIPTDGVVIATGARPRRLPGSEGVEGVHVLRTLDDAVALRSALHDGSPRVVVVGAGFIGAEVASTCRRLGLEVTVLDAATLPLEPLLGERIARCCVELHTDHGTEVRRGTSVARLRTGPGPRVTGVELDDGSVLPADVVVTGIGIVPNTEWLEGAGLSVANGVRTDEGMVCDLPNVVAVGDVARYRTGDGAHRHEHWTSAGEQAGVAATNLLAGRTTTAFRPSGYFWSDQYGRTLQLAGHPGREDRVEIVDGDTGDRTFTARWTDASGATTAVFGMGSPRAFGRLRRDLRRARQAA
ncbi:FAD-dependent oxidoreductase [Actinomycetospora endophytica]|uniref:FAD-dependent oxidoreductase n=1 Tax=Actinomycetospora endophytica TaxID=2291215 RepID=A0ABS8P8V0_9PSEU|nr:FAD-dependent oxidoreductase [Actinomycetospora endophytica]MCD2194684.1 FAD-dependent oxidoreductase [Actinomycetospora endophytica]